MNSGCGSFTLDLTDALGGVVLSGRKRKRNLYIDLDGTLAEVVPKLDWDETFVGPPIKNARTGCHLLSRHFRLVCFTARTRKDIVENWLRRHGFPDMPVTNVKGPVSVLLDDRAVPFTGEWDQDLIERLVTFTPFWDSKSDPLMPPSPPTDKT